MTISLFATQTVAQSGPLSGSTNPLLGGNGLGGLTGFDFLTALLGNVGEEDGDIKIGASNENTLDTETNEGLKKEAVDLTLLQLALLGQDADKNLEEKLAELKIENLSQTENNRVEQLTKLINHLTNGLPQEFSNESSIEDLVSRLNKRLETLEAKLDVFRSGDFGEDDAPFKLLIATGLNPAQLTKITNRIEEVEAKLGRELTVEDLIAGVGNIVPAPGEKDHEFAKTDALGLLVTKTDEEIAQDKLLEQKRHEDELQAELAAIDGLPVNNAQIPSGPTRTYDVQGLLNLIGQNRIAPVVTTPSTSIQPEINDSTILPEDGVTNVPQALSNAEFKALFGSKNVNTSGTKNNVAHLISSNITPDAATPLSSTSGSFTLPANWNSLQTSQNILSEILGYDVQTGTPFSHTMQAVHTSTTSQHAGQLHQGTSTVAAQMTKAASTGDTRALTLQLDPPELGRVEIRMEFGANNTVKAHLIVEKPETYLMLQRDAAALDRALQDAGMDTGSDSLNYEMAEDNYNFGDDKNGRGNNSGTENAKHNNDSPDDDGIEIIETTMNWNVDPTTGHVHYNIIA